MMAATGQGFLRTQLCPDFGTFLASNPSGSSGTQVRRLKEPALERREGLRRRGPWRGGWGDGGAERHPRDASPCEGGALVQGSAEATRRKQERRWPKNQQDTGIPKFRAALLTRTSTSLHLKYPRKEIGRASCRERVSSPV